MAQMILSPLRLPFRHPSFFVVSRCLLVCSSVFIARFDRCKFSENSEKTQKKQQFFL